MKRPRKLALSAKRRKCARAWARDEGGSEHVRTETMLEAYLSHLDPTSSVRYECILDPVALLTSQFVDGIRYKLVQKPLVVILVFFFGTSVG